MLEEVGGGGRACVRRRGDRGSRWACAPCIERPNQVWATDICYIPMAHGFMYLVAILDWYSRRVLAWRVSNTFDSDFCVEALEDALTRYGPPEIFNTDQGAQFTSKAFTTVLKTHAVAISMDGKGRWVDNVFVERLWRSVKYEDVYVPHPVPWTHICAMPPGVAHTPRAPRSACDTQASRDARSGCTAPRSRPRRRGRPRGSERFGRGSLAP